MNRKEKEKDVLKTLFSRMNEEALPLFFREKLMQKVLLEAAKSQKRNERIVFASIVFASLFMVVLAGLSIWYLGFPKMELRVPDLTIFPFYVYLGVLVLILLFADYKFRQEYKRKHQS